MNEMLRRILDAHGGLERWNEYNGRSHHYEWRGLFPAQRSGTGSNSAPYDRVAE